MHWSSPCTLQGGPKMAPFLYALTSSNINRFSKLFHYQNQEKICNKITIDATKSQACRYTTLWNVKCLKSNNGAIFGPPGTQTNNFTVSISNRLNRGQRGSTRYATSHKDCIGNAGRIKRAGFAETVIIKLNRPREFSGIFRNGNSRWYTSRVS